MQAHSACSRVRYGRGERISLFYGMFAKQTWLRAKVQIIMGRHCSSWRYFQPLSITAGLLASLTNLWPQFLLDDIISVRLASLLVGCRHFRPDDVTFGWLTSLPLSWCHCRIDVVTPIEWRRIQSVVVTSDQWGELSVSKMFYSQQNGIWLALTPVLRLGLAVVHYENKPEYSYSIVSGK